MAKVVLWERKLHKGSPVHIALEIDERNYVSWFPEEGRSISIRDQPVAISHIRQIKDARTIGTTMFLQRYMDWMKPKSYSGGKVLV